MLATRQCLSWHFPSIRGPLLRARRERPRDRPAPNERDELTPPHVEHSFSLRVSSSGLLGRQRAFRPARMPTEGSRRGPRRNKARLQRCRKPNPAASLQPAQSWWISLGRKSHARIGAEAACHRTYGLVLGADLNRSESSGGGGGGLRAQWFTSPPQCHLQAARSHSLRPPHAPTALASKGPGAASLLMVDCETP